MAREAQVASGRGGSVRLVEVVVRRPAETKAAADVAVPAEGDTRNADRLRRLGPARARAHWTTAKRNVAFGSIGLIDGAA